jgi:histidine ammonia-lyase
MRETVRTSDSRAGDGSSQHVRHKLVTQEVSRLGADDLTPARLWECAEHALDPYTSWKIEIVPAATERIQRAADYVGRVLDANRPVYGVNTGFGHFANVVVPADRCIELQYNIVRSHCCGVGEYLSRDIVMAMWLIELATICQGASGVSVETAEGVVRILEAGILACVPSRGSVGASGDLAPAAHATRAIVGEGLCTIPEDGRFIEISAGEALRKKKLNPVRLRAKEGLSLINGTNLTTALAVKAWYEGRELLRVANLVAAMSMEVLGACRCIFAEPVLRAHRHLGTMACGKEVASWLDCGSEIAALPGEDRSIQDPYSLRCVPQVHGAVWEELQRCEEVLLCEINAATDNPLLFPDKEIALCGGNFHAIYPARVSDCLASAFTTLASISERRISQAMHPGRRCLPTFLINDGGVNSGFMMAQVTAAALVSECKTLSVPASVDSIPTNCSQEDHVSMGPIAGFKAIRVMENVRRVLAIELLATAQAIDLLSPRKPARRLAEIHARIREFVPPLHKDRSLSEDIELVARKIHVREVIPR